MKRRIISILLTIQLSAVLVFAIDMENSLEPVNHTLDHDELIFDGDNSDQTSIGIEVIEVENAIDDSVRNITLNNTMNEFSPENSIAVESKSSLNEDVSETNEEENVISEISDNTTTETEEKIKPNEKDVQKNNIFEDEMTTIENETVSESIVLNRENIIENDFLGNIIVEIESGNHVNIDLISNNSNANFINNNETMTIDESVYSTAPVIENVSSLRAESPVGMRFTAVVSLEQRYAAVEYGFLVANTEDLEDNNIELTFDVTEITFLSGISYSVTENIDKVFYIDENENYVFSMVLLNIPETAFLKDVTARPYIIYNIDGVETIIYGGTYSNSVYRTAKNEVVTSENNAVVEYAQRIIDSVENSGEYLNSAVEVSFAERIDGNIGKTPDIDVVKFVPEVSSLYTLALTSTEGAIYEVLDKFGCKLSELEINNITNETAYLFEKAQTYYIRVKGNPNTSYSIQATTCLQEAIIYDFFNDTEGFTFGNSASGESENGILNISINKSAGFTKAYIKNNTLSVDLFDYSRVIIRMKNTTDTTKLSGSVEIDLEYDGTYIDYSLESSMPANMTTFENIEFDFTTRYGAARSLKLTFGQLLSSLSGNIYIDSIVIFPMPEVMAWEFDETTENWSYTDLVSSMSVESGVLVLDMLGRTTNLAPAILSPETSAYDFRKYDILKICLKNETAADDMQLYFSTLAEGYDNFSEDKKFVVEIQPSTTEYIEYTINLYDHASFTDSLKGIMISIPAEGTVSIDYIRLYKNIPNHENVIWGFENNLSGFYSGSERHVLSESNENLIVTSQSVGTGGFYTPLNLDLPTEAYRYLVIGVNSASETSNFEAYFKTSTMASYRENDHNNKVVYKHVLKIDQSSTFKEYVIDLSHAQEGYTSGYIGTLKQFMLAFTTPGTYEIDYIKLTNGNENKELFVSATKGCEYKILILKNNNHTVGTYTLKYDPTVFELIDACVYSYPSETGIGTVAGTDITIVSIANSTVTFRVLNDNDAGTINCLKFQALKNSDSKLSLQTSIK